MTRAPRGNRYQIRKQLHEHNSTQRLFAAYLLHLKIQRRLLIWRTVLAQRTKELCPPVVFYPDGRMECVPYGTGPAFEYAHFRCTNNVFLLHEGGPVDAVVVDRIVLTRHRLAYHLFPGTELYAYFAEEQRSAAEKWADAWFEKRVKEYQFMCDHALPSMPYVADLMRGKHLRTGAARVYLAAIKDGVSL